MTCNFNLISKPVKQHTYESASAENRLVAAAKAGNRAAIEQIWKTYHGVTSAYLRRLGCGAEQAEDIAAVVLHRLLDPKRHYIDHAHFKASVRGSARNAFIDYYRSAKSEQYAVQRLSESISQCTNCHHSNSETEQIETRLVLREAISKLPDIYQRIITLYDFEQLNVTTIGGMLGIPPKGVYPRRQIALRLLRSILAAMDYHPCENR